MASHLSAEGSVPSSIWWRLGISLVIAGQSMVFGLGINLTPLDAFSVGYWVFHGLLLISSLVVIALLGPRLIKESFTLLFKGRLTVEIMFFLSAFGALFASILSTLRGEGPVFYEVVAIVLSIYTLGKTVGIQAKDKAWAEVRKLRQLASQAFVVDQNNRLSVCDLKDVRPGMTVVVEPGQMITVDGVVLQGQSYVEETAMTGEPAPLSVGVGARVLAGTYSLDGRLTIKVQHSMGERLLDAVLMAVESAGIKPSALQEQADRWMQKFVPSVLVISIAAFIFGTLRFSWVQGLFNSMAVLLVACPCALGLATPIAVWSALWNLANKGLVIKTGVFLDILARSSAWVFDKTGTLSESVLKIQAWVIEPKCKEQEQCIKRMVALVESGLSHPIAQVLAQSVLHEKEGHLIDHQWIAGCGVQGSVCFLDKTYSLRVGDLNWLGKPHPPSGKWIGIEMDGSYVGRVLLEEALKEDANATFKGLLDLGMDVFVLTGDKTPLWERIVDIPVEAGLSPLQKADRVKVLKEAGHTVLFVGDGINDAIAMTQAAASVAMNAGAGLAINSAEAVLLGNRLSPLLLAVKVAKRVQASIRSNIIIALIYNLVGVSFAAMGYLHPVFAALLMGVSSLLVAYRALKAAKVEGV